MTAIADLPAEVTKVIQRDRSENPARRRKIIQSLLDVQPATPADVADEIPWALMGRMLREISFYQAWRQMRPESETTGTGSIEDLPSLYADHPDAGFLRMAQASSAESRKAFRTLLETVDADGMEFQQWPLVDFLGRETNSNFRGPMFLNVAIQNRMDDVARDIVRRIQNEPNPNSVPRAKRLLAISPYHPTGRTTLIRFAWDQVRGQAADWERTSRTQSTVLVALGKQYAATNDSASARRLLKAMADVTPTAANVAALAIEYDHEGNHAAWEKTVERLVTLPDLRNRGTVHAQLVDNYMAHGEWQKARPHADAAIESGESAGLIGGASFFEAQQIWDNAEAAYRKASETDPAMSFEWYFYCKRTGHGDVKEAHKLGAKSMTDRQEQVSREPQAYMFMLTPPATYYLLAGKPEVARRYFVEEFMRAGDPFCGMHAALISDQLKDPKLRDQQLAEIAARHGGWARISPARPHNEIVALAAMFVADLGKKTNGDLDFKAIDNLLEKSTEMERINCRYFVGQICASAASLNWPLNRGCNACRCCRCEPSTGPWQPMRCLRPA